jgi:hypothetical protein
LYIGKLFTDGGRVNAEFARKQPLKITRNIHFGLCMPGGCRMCRGQSHLRIACNSDADFASVGKNFENEQVSNVDVASAQCVGFNEVASRFHFVSHEHGEHTIGFDGIVDLHAQQAAHRGVHGGLP